MISVTVGKFISIRVATSRFRPFLLSRSVAHPVLGTSGMLMTRITMGAKDNV